ncbi:MULTISPECIES: MFS transporter [Lacticaseibacillus]|uniref:MFS transporter n=1 Tax=Lacticaseibacillus TaxID=2759736 RepID=UPI00063DCFB9|nr:MULTISPECIES: MFS transporter [Lacticaseibacillus]KLI75437.1 hypothetical protein AAW28_07975 [Lacticaseibacillus casei]
MKLGSEFFKLVTGRLVSNFGDSLYSISLSWFIIRSTQDSFWLGFLNAAVFAPNLFAFIFGRFIDVHSKKRILIFLEFGQFLGMVVLLVSLMLGFFNPLWISSIVFFSAIFSMNTYTTQDAFLPSLVTSSQLEKAQSIMSSSYRAADILFNALSGFLASAFQAWHLLIVSAAAFAGSTGIFASMNNDASSRVEPPAVDRPKVWFGFTLIFRDSKLTILTFSGLIANFLFAGSNIYVVLIADKLNTAIALGLFLGSAAIGSLIGTLYVSQTVLQHFGIGGKLVVGQLGFGLFTMISALCTNSILFIIPFTLAAVFLGVTFVSQNPIIQNEVASDSLGQVFSAKYTLEVGIMPIGSLFFGEIAKHMTSALFFLIFGLAYLGLGAVTYLNKGLRQYRI